MLILSKNDIATPTSFKISSFVVLFLKNDFNLLVKIDLFSPY